MMEAGVHFGHGTRKWNPRMAPYISGKRKGIHITNLTRTAPSIGKHFLIVGTKHKAVDSVASVARARCHYVNKKWLGGLHKFRDLRAEQKMGRFNHLPKRDAAMLNRQLSHLQTYLGAIKYMMGLPDIVIIVDHQEEYTAIRECLTLGIPTICLIDTNCDPDLADRNQSFTRILEGFSFPRTNEEHKAWIWGSNGRFLVWSFYTAITKI
ncbi:hypothetical protein AMTRI_Chr06g200060 [Amborella trichopoda]